MAQRVAKCSECGGQVAIDVGPEGGDAECRGCGAKFRVRVRTKPPSETPEAGPEAGPVIAPNPDDLGGYDLAEDPLPPPRSRPSQAPKPTPPEAFQRAEKADDDDEGSGSALSWIRENSRLVAAASGGLVLVALLAIVGALTLGRRGGEEAGAGVGAKVDQAGAKRPKGTYVVIDTPVPGVEPAPDAKQPPLFVEVPAVDPKTLVALKPKEEAPPTSPAEVIEEKPRWDLPPDPRPKDAPPIRYAADLRIPVESFTLERQPETRPPILAGREGPFAVFMPAWPESPYSLAAEVVQGRMTTVLKEKPQAPPPVIDLRTGEKVGEFFWKSPFWRDPRLSPDGRFLVAPDATLDWLSGMGLPQVGKVEPNALFVWEQKREKPSRKLAYKGRVSWAEFVAEDRLALYLNGDKPSLQVWDVARGKPLAQVPLSIEPFAPPRLPSGMVVDWYFPWPTLGAVSPGGRYVALGGANGIALVALADGREVGTLSVALSPHKNQREFRGMAFSPDGAELLLLTNSEVNKTRLRAWSVTDGRLRRDLSFAFLSMAGSPLMGPEPETVLAPGYPVADEPVDNSPMAAKLAESSTGRYLTGHHAILRWADDGPVLALGPLKDGPTAGANGRLVVFTTDAVHAQFRDANNLTEFRLPKRPKPKEADRSSLKAQTPEIPESWTAPPVAKLIGPPADPTTLPARPAAFGGGQAAVVRFEMKVHELPGNSIRRHEVYWDRYDALSGKPIGQPILLWPWAVDPLHKPGGPSLQPAALSDDGERLAFRDPETPGRVDVWNTAGERILGLEPYGPKGKVEWVDGVPRAGC